MCLWMLHHNAGSQKLKYIMYIFQILLRVNFFLLSYYFLCIQ